MFIDFRTNIYVLLRNIGITLIVNNLEFNTSKNSSYTFPLSVIFSYYSSIRKKTLIITVSVLNLESKRLVYHPKYIKYHLNIRIYIYL